MIWSNWARSNLKVFWSEILKRRVWHRRAHQRSAIFIAGTAIATCPANGTLFWCHTNTQRLTCSSILSILFYYFLFLDRGDGESHIGCCGYILMLLSWLLIIVTFPFSLCLCIKVRNFFKNNWAYIYILNWCTLRSVCRFMVEPKVSLDKKSPINKRLIYQSSIHINQADYVWNVNNRKKPNHIKF